MAGCASKISGPQIPAKSRAIIWRMATCSLPGVAASEGRISTSPKMARVSSQDISFDFARCLIRQYQSIWSTGRTRIPTIDGLHR